MQRQRLVKVDSLHQKYHIISGEQQFAAYSRMLGSGKLPTDEDMKVIKSLRPRKAASTNQPPKPEGTFNIASAFANLNLK